MSISQLSPTTSFPALVAPSAPATAVPVSDVERNPAVDTVRGVALLGILLLNVSGFALPGVAYYDGSVGSHGSATNLTIWFVCQMLFEGKMRALFSMLFGAGVILLTSRAEAQRRTDVADVYSRRTLWLIAFGVIDSFLLLWPADVLYDYGVSGLLLYPLRRLSPRALIVAGLLVLGVLVYKDYGRVQRRATAAVAATAAHRRFADAPTQRMSAADVATLRSWSRRLDGEKPSPKALADEGDSRRLGYIALVKSSVAPNMDDESYGFYDWKMWDVLGMMLIGMALLKLGFFTGDLPMRAYLITAALGYAVALPVNWWSTSAFMAGGLSGSGVWLLDLRNQPGRLVMALSHASVIVACVKAGLFRPITRRLAAVGQMALTNYLMQTIICNILFSGVGFGLFGRLDRLQLLGVVVAIWIAQLLISPIWLARFRFGPMEWLWRSLTYVKRQPMRRPTAIA